MNVRVVATADQSNRQLCENKTVVVIDVLRATSVIVTALAHGAKAIVPVASVEKALNLYASFPSNTAFLCGERNGRVIEGFHAGNSPFEYMSGRFQNKNLILCTSNGTKAITNSDSARELLLVSFLNLNAVANYLSKTAADFVIVCSGTNSVFSMDDGLCAGMLLNEISQNINLQTDDLGHVLQNFYLNSTETLKQKLSSCYHVNYLQSIGFQKDIDYCLQTDIHNLLPRFVDGKITI